MEADLAKDAAAAAAAAADAATKETSSTETTPTVPSVQNLDDAPVVSRLTFNDMDSVLTEGASKPEEVLASKDIDRLEQISAARALERKLEEEQEAEEDRIKILDEPVSLDFTDLGATASAAATAADLDLGIQEL